MTILKLVEASPTLSDSPEGRTYARDGAHHQEHAWCMRFGIVRANESDGNVKTFTLRGHAVCAADARIRRTVNLVS